MHLLSVDHMPRDPETQRPRDPETQARAAVACDLRASYARVGFIGSRTLAALHSLGSHVEYSYPRVCRVPF
jgi:hypothetical protein